MVSTTAVSWSNVARRALAAGIAGAVTIDLFIWLAIALPAGQSMIGVWQFIASTVFGSVAFTQPAYAFAGIAMHVCISIGWAGGYAYFAATQPGTNRRWIVAGAAYGVVVYVLMQLILLGSGHFKAPATPNAFVLAVAAHVVFGLTVAYVVRALSSVVA